MKKIIIVFTIALLSIGFSDAQSLSQVVVASSGATLTGTSNTLSFTAGEAVIGTVTSGKSLEQGFWNGAIKGIILSNKDFLFDIQITAYPNPVFDYLNLSSTEMTGKDLEVQIYDTQGRQVFGKELPNSSGNVTLNLSEISAGIYIAAIVESSSNKSTSFKIYKH